MIPDTSWRRIEPDIDVLQVSGRLHLGNNLGSLEAEIHKLIEGGCRKFIVDLTELKYIDSASIGMLIGCNGEMETLGGRMRIAGANGGVAKSFEIVHLGRVVAIDLDVATAQANLA